MLLSEPPRTPYDLHFSVLGIPVRVHPLFWIMALLLGMHGTRGEPILVVIWVATVFVSVLIHELGHALAARAHGWPPSITLQTFGGLATYRPTYRSLRADFIITLAGPMAGFFLAAMIAALVKLLRYELITAFGPFGFYVYAQGIHNFNASVLVNDLLQVNIFWGLLNLLPVYPLDGGQIARTLMLAAGRREAIRESLQLSVAVGAAMAAYALLRLDDGFLCMFFASLAFSSYQMLQFISGRGGFNSGPW